MQPPRRSKAFCPKGIMRVAAMRGFEISNLNKFGIDNFIYSLSAPTVYTVKNNITEIREFQNSF